MKKFLIVVLAAFFCLAFTLPAMAKITMGGRVALDWTWVNDDDELASGGVEAGDTPTSNGFKDMRFVMPVPLNRLNMKYTSDDGALSAFVEFRGGGPRNGGSGVFNYGYITWQVTPSNSITFGRQTTNFARFIINQFVGTHTASLIGVEWGNVNHTTVRTGIKGYWRISDMFGLVWGLWDADIAQPGSGIIIATTGSTVFSGNQENTLPRIDLALPIRFPWGRIEPSVTWSQAEYDQAPAGGEDSYDMWGVNIGGTGSWGMFSATAEITYGKNLGGGSYRGAEGAKPIAYVNSAGNVQVEDADVLAWFIDIGFKFGPNKIDLYYGSIAYENDGDPTVTGSSDSAEYDFEQVLYGISWAIGVAKGFTIRPELNFYDFDSDAKADGTITNRGERWLLGIQFQLIF